MILFPLAIALVEIHEDKAPDKEHRRGRENHHPAYEEGLGGSIHIYVSISIPQPIRITPNTIIKPTMVTLTSAAPNAASSGTSTTMRIPTSRMVSLISRATCLRFRTAPSWSKCAATAIFGRNVTLPGIYLQRVRTDNSKCAEISAKVLISRRRSTMADRLLTIDCGLSTIDDQRSPLCP